MTTSDRIAAALREQGTVAPCLEAMVAEIIRDVLATERDALADAIEASIEKRTHMARRLYPDVYKGEVADDVIEFLTAVHGERS